MQRCNCAHQEKREFDAKEAFDNLSHKYRELARLMSQYMSEAKLDRSARVNNASAMADELDRIVGGQPTTAFRSVVWSAIALAATVSNGFAPAFWCILVSFLLQDIAMCRLQASRFRASMSELFAPPRKTT